MARALLKSARHAAPEPLAPLKSPWRFLTTAALALMLALVVIRVTISESARSDFSAFPNTVAAPATPGPTTGLVLDLLFLHPGPAGGHASPGGPQLQHPLRPLPHHHVRLGRVDAAERGVGVGQVPRGDFRGTLDRGAGHALVGIQLVVTWLRNAHPRGRRARPAAGAPRARLLLPIRRSPRPPPRDGEGPCGARCRAGNTEYLRGKTD